MMSYIDKSFFENPLAEYFWWLFTKTGYQLKYWGNHLRISYKAKIKNTIFGRYNWIGREVILVNSQLGSYTYIQSGSLINNCSIGSFCSIGANVTIAPGKHPTTRFVSTYPSFFSTPGNLLDNFTDQNVFETSVRVDIGHDVWIASNVLIIDGIKIGNGAVVAANAVVTEDVEPYSIVGGVPAKHLKYRFLTDEIAFLQEFKWWDKEVSWLKANVSKFWSLEDFIKSFK
jgi:acetyltransferase-like isoleucine patch superfamily enzyme